jgi:hypothetical protein
VLAHAGGDAHVAQRELGAERMMRRIEPSAPEVVADRLGGAQTEIELRFLSE